jgi:alanyl-tRNA synthetase
MENLEDLQKRKLAFEITELGQPYRKRPTFWLSIASALIAVVGVIGQSYLSSIKSERAMLAVETAEEKRKELDKENAAIQEKITDLKRQYQRESERVATLTKATKELRDIAAKTPLSAPEQQAIAQSRNAVYWVGVLGPQGAANDIQTVTDYLKNNGYTVKFAGNVNGDEPWFAKEATIFYYSERTKPVANQLASELTKILGKPVKMQVGGFYDVPPDQKEWLLYVHIL